mgnify:FL=1
MQYLYEYSDTMNTPYEAFLYSSDKNSMPVHPHWHYYAETIYILEGHALITCDGKDYSAEADDMVLFHPEAVHAIYNTTNAPLSYCVVKFDISRLVISNSYTPKLRTIFRAARGNEHCPVLFTADSYEHERSKGIFFRLIYEITHRDYGYDLMMHSHLCILMMDILRIWQSMGFSTDNISENADESAGESIRSVTEYIDAHSSDNLTVEDLAKRCGMSYSYFAKQFREFYGKSCKEYIEFIRICKAEDMLLFTSHDLNYISQETGFSDCSHLIKTFKKIKGVTPKQYRLKRNGN